jgi:hypothetical protein
VGIVQANLQPSLDCFASLKQNNTLATENTKYTKRSDRMTGLDISDALPAINSRLVVYWFYFVFLVD